MNRYIIGILALFGLAILLIVLLFTGSPSKVAPPKTTSFSSYVNSNSEVQLVITGAIVAPQNHNSIDINVNEVSASYKLMQGYDGNVINSKIFNNSQNSYKNFLYALYYAGYTKGQSLSYSSDTGLCPTGTLYDYYLYNNGQTVQHYWATNCANVPRTYLGNLPLTLTLFEGQIPNFGTLSQNTFINGL